MQTPVRLDVSHYAYNVIWSAEDGEFVATCVEFPSLSWLAGSQVEALQGLQSLIGDVIADMQEQGEEVPQPLAERTYSGKFQVRLGENLHRRLVVQAAQDGLSLNQLVVRKLADA